MKSRWSVLSLLLGLVVLLGACSGRNAVQPEPEAEVGTPIGTITLVPVNPPRALRTENLGAPIGVIASGIANGIMDKYKSGDFNTQYADYREQVGAKMTAAMMRELQQRGFSVKLAPAGLVERSEEGYLNYAKFPADSVVMEVQFDNFAMYSGRWTRNYGPLVDVYMHVGTPKYEQDGYLFDLYYLYGGWANRTGNGYVESDPKYAFPSFAALQEQSDLVRESYDDGINKLAKQLVLDFRMQFRPTIVAARAVAADAAPAPAAKPVEAAAPTKKTKRRKSKRAAKAEVKAAPATASN